MPLAPPVTTTTALAKVEAVVVGAGGGDDDDGESVVSWMFLSARREMSNPSPRPSPRPMAPVHDPGILIPIDKIFYSNFFFKRYVNFIINIL